MAVQRSVFIVEHIENWCIILMECILCASNLNFELIAFENHHA